MAAASEKPAIVAAYLTDLIFQTKIVSTGQSLGAEVLVAGSPEALHKLVTEKCPGLVLLDLNARDALAALAEVAVNPRTHRVIAYVSHVDRELADAARCAGVDDVLPRSRFVVELPGLIRSSLAE